MNTRFVTVARTAGRVSSVASFFVSRIDTIVDDLITKRLGGALAGIGMSLRDVTDRLLEDGVRAFIVAFQAILAALAVARASADRRSEVPFS
jgi:transaldolase